MHKNILIVIAIFTASIIFGGCSDAVPNADQNETAVAPAETLVSEFPDQIPVFEEETSTNTKKYPTSEETATISDNKSTGGGSDKSGITEEAYRCCKIVNAYGGWQTTDLYDDLFIITDNGITLTADNYLHRDGNESLIESYKLSERDLNYEQEIKALIGKDISLESYVIGDSKHISILQDEDIIIREGANGGLLFYKRNSSDSSVINAFEKSMTTSSDSFSVAPILQTGSDQHIQSGSDIGTN